MRSLERGVDARRARDAGMVSHVGKPVDPAELYRVLGEWVVPDPAKPFDALPVEGRAAGASEAAVEADLPESLPGVDLADGLGHLAGNRRAYRRLLLQFGRENRLLDDLREALSAFDFETALEGMEQISRHKR